MIVKGATYDDWTDSGMDIVTECNVDVMADMWAQSDVRAYVPEPYGCLRGAPSGLSVPRTTTRCWRSERQGGHLTPFRTPPPLL